MKDSDNRVSNLRLVRQGLAVEGKKNLAIRDSFVTKTGPALVKGRHHHAFRTYLLALWCHYPKGQPRLPSHLENKHLAVLLGIGRKSSGRRSSMGHVLAILEERSLLKRSRRGRNRTLLLRHESGTGRPYALPKGGGANAYIELPGQFFANDWINELSAPSILVLLIALREQRFLKHRRSKEDWKRTKFDWYQTAERLSQRYGISKTTVEKGLRELRQIGFLTARRSKINPRNGRRMAQRNLYSNHPEVFNSKP